MMGTKRKRDDQPSRLEDFIDSMKFSRTILNLNVEEADYDYLFILRDIFLGRIKFGGDVDDNGSEPEYKQFLESVTTDYGGSYAHKTPAADEPSVFVRYDEKLKKTKRSDSQTVKGAEKRDTKGRGEVPMARAPDSQLKSKPQRISDAIARKARLESRRFKRCVLDGKDKSAETSLKGDKRCSNMTPVVDCEASALVSSHPCGSFGDGAPLESSPPPQPDFKKKYEMRLHVEDEDYGRFLSCLQQCCHDDIVFKPNEHEELIYDRHGESTSDSDVMIMDDPFLDGGFSPFVPKTIRFLHPVDEDEGMDDYQCTEQSHFRVSLMKCIEEPYNELELNDHWKKMLEKKPVDCNKENRSGKSRINQNKLGSSYLEHHQEFEKKLKSVHDNHKRLLLLRSFFFWLKNAGHDDSFRPWIDAQFLKMVL